MNTMADGEREKFEAWAYKECLTLHKWGNGEYSYERTDSAWKGWQSSIAARQPVGEVSVKKEDANNYCLILRALGMEEEGDPVAEVMALIEARDRQSSGEPVCTDCGTPLLYECVGCSKMNYPERPQAVDLGRVRKLASWVANCAGHGINDSQRRLGEELLALIDSQAVGNK